MIRSFVRRHAFSVWVFCCAVSSALAAEIHLAQGLLAGEVTATTAILQTRLTSVAGLVSGDVAGAPGVGRFEIAIDESFRNARLTPWMNATAEGDFIA